MIRFEDAEERIAWDRYVAGALASAISLYAVDASLTFDPKKYAGKEALEMSDYSNRACRRACGRRPPAKDAAKRSS